jgi:hypothetical protein
MRSIFKAAAIIVAAALVLILAAAWFIDEPLRRRTEAKINAALDGYTVHIGKLDFHPIGFSLDLEDSIIVQNAHPDAPVAHIPKLTASVNWRALIFGRVVADFTIDRPTFFIDLTHAETEIRDEVPIEERGWQHALQAIYPLKINQFTISNGELTYVDKGPYKPLHLTNANFRANNIRNVRSETGVYPSPVYLEANVFDRGKLLLDGHADFLAEPHVAVNAALTLDQIALDYFRPITERYHFAVKQGVLSGSGTIEYAAHTRVIEIPTLKVRSLQADYIHVKTDESPTRELSRKTDRVIRETSNEPTLQVYVNEVHIDGAELGVVNRASDPNYRLFVNNVSLNIKNLGNQSEDGVAVGTASGKFMGSGNMRLVAHLRPYAKSPNFDLALSIEETEMVAMNNLLRAYVNFDVAAGLFSFYSEIAVRDGFVDGYVKPLFSEVKVHDPRQDRHRSIFRRVYERLLDGLAWVLENRPREEIATSVKVSGKLSDPETRTLDVVLGLIENAFFRAILPGFESSIERQPRR